MKRRPAPETIRIGNNEIAPGRSARFELPVARLPTQTYLSIPFSVLNGARSGPRIWLSAAIHGDEINGIEIIRRVLKQLDPKTMRGSVIAVPIVNVFGFINESRYLPDRRDLNRSFPGSKSGSLAARLAHLFLTEVVDRCSYGIDLHTAATHRTNLPQIRTDLDDPETRRCAEAFGAPIMLHSRTRDGSLRDAAVRRGATVLLYEGGAPNRFNEDAIRIGREGVLRVLRTLGIIQGKSRPKRNPSVESRSSSWVRARRSGLFHRGVNLGDRVEVGQTLGVIRDGFGDLDIPVPAARAGVVIGLALNPLVNRGNALVHVAEP